LLALFKEEIYIYIYIYKIKINYPIKMAPLTLLLLLGVVSWLGRLKIIIFLKTCGQVGEVQLMGTVKLGFHKKQH